MPEAGGQLPIDWKQLEEAFARLSHPEQRELLKRLQERQRETEYVYEPSPPEPVEVLELMVPERLAYLPELFGFLREQLTGSGYKRLLSGYSILEVKGAFAGEQVYDEPTLIIRLIYDRDQFRQETEAEDWLKVVDNRIKDLADELIRITKQQEEQIWILRYTATVAKYIREEREK